MDDNKRVCFHYPDTCPEWVVEEQRLLALVAKSRRSCCEAQPDIEECRREAARQEKRAKAAEALLRELADTFPVCDNLACSNHDTPARFQLVRVNNNDLVLFSCGKHEDEGPKVPYQHADLVRRALRHLASNSSGQGAVEASDE